MEGLEIRELLREYPTLTAGPQPVKLGVREAPNRQRYLELGFDQDLQYVGEVEQVVDIWTSPLTSVVDADRITGWLLPAVGGNTTAQHPVVTWFLVLYGLSMLARYHPVTWRRMLDVDKNSRATSLESFISHDSESSMRFIELAVREFDRRAASSLD